MKLAILKPNSHMSPTIGDLLSVAVDPENSQNIPCIDSCEQSSSLTIATYENQPCARLGLVNKLHEICMIRMVRTSNLAMSKQV